MSVMDVRRLVRALLLGGLVFLVVGGGAGLALAAVADPEPAAMAFPRPGASATYTVKEFHVGEASGRLTIDSITLTWMPETWISDGDFHLRLVHPLQTELRARDVYQVREAFYDAATGEPILTSGTGEYRADAGVGCGSTTDCRFRYDSYDGRGGPCAARNALQEGQSIQEPLRVTGYCDYVDGQDEMVYHFAGRERIGPYDTHRFQDPTRPEFKAWFTSDLPFPARFTSTLSDNVYYGFLGHERMYDMRISEYKEGKGLYTRPQESLVQQGPGPLPPVPMLPLLFDFDGFPAPLSFPDAYAAAATDTSENGLAGFLMAHPDSYVAEAYTQESLDENGATHYAWLFVVTDGQAWKSLSVRLGPAGLYLLGRPVWAPSDAGTSVWVESWDLDEEAVAARDGGRYYVAPSLLPRTLPRPVDVLHRQAFVENNEVPDSRYFGWRFTCETPACLGIETWVAAGYQIRINRAPLVPGIMASGVDGDSAILAVAASGQPLYRSAFSYDRPSYNPLIAGSDPSSPDYRLAPQSIAQPVPVWSITEEAVASLSFLVVLASGLYYFWPAVKGGAVGLFSRIEPERVLDHPSRARLFALIEANPGIHFQDLARRSAFGHGQLDHHVRKLQAAGLVSRVQGAQYACFFARGQVDRRLMAAAPVLRSDGARRLLAAVERRPGASVRDLAPGLGLAVGTVSYHAKRLQDAGLLQSQAGAYHLTPLGQQASLQSGPRVEPAAVSAGA